MRFTWAAVFVPFLRLTECIPVIDLGYELYQPTEFNERDGYWNFSNIRYAAPPVGHLRFQAPRPPAKNRAIVQDGRETRICPQAQPAWMATTPQWLFAYLTKGIQPNGTNSANMSLLPARDPRENEDCLFLDIFAPKTALDNVKNGTGAPVMVEIHGGGYVQGSKSESNPWGLLRRGKNVTSEEFLYVRINYRLGAFGFMSGPTFQQDGTPNAGLLDQRKALQWVQDHIHRFGGDKNRVSVIGSSAGAGSIIHQVTAFGGEHSQRLFHRAMPLSSAWFPSPAAFQQEEVFHKFLHLANAASLYEARALSTEELIHANAVQILNAAHGTFVFGPTIDGDLVRDDPRSLLVTGRFDKSVEVFMGHTPNEGLGFSPPAVTDAEYVQGLQDLFPHAIPRVIDHIADTLYPPIFNSSLYSDNVRRMGLTVTEAVFTCAVPALGRGLARANSSAYGYVLEDGFGLHGSEGAFAYYDGNDTVNRTLAYTLQDYLTTFAAHGLPKSEIDELERLVPYGENGNIVRMSSAGIDQERDPAANARCEWWQPGLYR
ncbi:carboxylesterase type b [Fusarium avenaceum]|nr:carboxylesterase type b [Fusarium avenaceum]